MLQDRYGNALATASATARDRYVDGVDRFLAAMPGVEEAFEAAVAADDGFALGYAALARTRQAMGMGGDTKTPMAAAQALAGGLSAREAAHVDALGLLVAGKSQ